MRMVKLGDVAKINPRAARLPADTQVSFVGMAQLDAVNAKAIPLDERNYADVSKGYTQFRDGDILVAKITPCWENGKVGIADLNQEFGYGSTEFHVIRPGQELNERYLLHYLRQDYIRASGELKMTGSGGQRRVPVKFFSNMLVPLPSLDEQRRIAAILDKADAIRAKRRQVLADLDALKASLFNSMFQVKEYPSSCLNDVSLGRGEYGATVASTEISEDLPRYVRITDIREDGTLSDEARGPAGEYSEWRRYLLNEGDILFARSGATVGKTFRYRTSDGPCVYAGYLIRFVPNPELIDSDFLYAYTRTSKYRGWVAARQNVVAQPNINAKQYGSELMIPLPPMEEQKEFARRTKIIDRVIASAKHSFERDTELFASLQSRAFKGEL